MSYTPTTWQTGDTITAEKLNKMEGGIEANTPLIINFHESEDMSMYLTTSEVLEYFAAISNKKIFYVSFNGSEAFPAHTIANGIEAHLENIPALAIFDESDSGVFQFKWNETPYDGKVFGQFFPDTFIVTLTPTAQDFSGTMDKTVAEINAAYEAGKTIAFKIYTDQSGSYIVSKNVLTMWGSGATKFGFYSNAVIEGVGLVIVSTGINPPSDRTTYLTAIYPLTPMS